VFFSKLEEMRELSSKHPEMIPYLPPKISIFAEQNQTVLVTANPATFKDMYPSEDLTALFDRLEKDTRDILEAVRLAE